ncbi:DUF262 domain-containing protein [Desulfovibrio sp.]
MKCEATVLEIETILNRIECGDIDLQPDFQRGEVWSSNKQRKLIDSILREWRIPPIHFVQNRDAIDEVLDGQQRLVAIRDFYSNKFCIDGYIEPYDQLISELHGKFYKDLKDIWQRRFKRYNINIVRLTEFKPSEPAELFYRLNQPTALTSAEQRNAYMGITRDQVKHLSDMFVKLGASKEVIGFSNSRLAYDEIISKFCYTVEQKTLKQKVTSTDLSVQYREGIPFSDTCINIVEATINKFLMCVTRCENISFSLNKATLFSWLIFIRRNLTSNEDVLRNVITQFEFCRAYVKGRQKINNIKYKDLYIDIQYRLPFLEIMLNTFNQRASMGSTDALSIIYRDIILSLFYESLTGIHTDLFDFSIRVFEEQKNMNYVLEEISNKYNWGEVF